MSDRGPQACQADMAIAPVVPHSCGQHCRGDRATQYDDTIRLVTHMERLLQRTPSSSRAAGHSPCEQQLQHTCCPHSCRQEAQGTAPTVQALQRQLKPKRSCSRLCQGESNQRCDRQPPTRACSLASTLRMAEGIAARGRYEQTRASPCGPAAEW